MQNGKDKKPQGFLSALIGEGTPSKHAGLSYSLCALVFFVVVLLVGTLFTGREDSQGYLYCSFLVAPVGFAVVIAWYFSYTKTSFKGFLKEQKCHPKYYLLAFTMQLGLLSLGELNVWILKLLEGAGYVDSGIALPSTKGAGLFGVLLVIAVIPAVMEEFFFRGVFQRETKGFSLWGQILLCGGLFALYHQNPAQTAYQFVCGVAFALVAAKAGSFFPTVLSHFLNNAAVVILYSLGIESYPLPAHIALLVVETLCLVGSVLYLIVWDKKEEAEEEKGSYKQLFACASFGLLLFGFSWLATLLAGF